MYKTKQINQFIALIVVLVICGLIGFQNCFVKASTLENEIVETVDNFEMEAFEEIEHGQATVSLMATSSNDDFKKETDAVIPADTVGFSNRKLIPNHDYFRARPNHGLNNSSGIPGTCGEVAAQLTLSYHNFYSDRRIIENEFLLGRNDPNNEIERNRNPNFSTNPMLMERDALGSNAAYHAHLNSNFGHLFGGTSLANVKNGIAAELNRNNISYTINSKGVLWGLGLFDSVSSVGIKAEIDAGRPVPICIAKNLGADGNHWVVAYGYQHINGVFGYIVHYGWTGTDREFAWINANWASGYISLNINHIHNYDYVGGQWCERRCTDCQHRQHPFIVDNNGILTSLRYNNIMGNIVIPNGIRIPSVNRNIDTPLVMIGSNAFQNSGISKITIPMSVTNIEPNAFENCTSLTNVTLSNNLTSIGSFAFKGCISLRSITIPDSVTDIGSNAFENCTSLENVIVQSETAYNTNLGSNIFIGCDILESIKVPSYSIVEYMNSTNWYSYSHLIIMDTSPIWLQLDGSETELILEEKYYETLNRNSFAYYFLETPSATSNISYTVNSTIVGARTNMWLYDLNGNLITYDFGDYDHNGAKIITNLAPSTTYMVLLFLESYYIRDDYTIQFYETDKEIFHLDWNSLPKQYFDPITYDYVNFVVFSSCYDLVFDEETKTIIFGRIECYWDVTFSYYPNCPEEYVIGMLIGNTYNSIYSTLAFFSFNGFYEYRAALPYTYSYSATVTNVSITFSDSDWSNYVTVGPR